MTGDLLESLRYEGHPTASDLLADPPPLNGETYVILNAETSGLAWWDGDRPIGWSYLLPASGRKGYIPAGDKCRQWMRCELKGVHIDNINTKFDLHQSRADGVDLVEGTGNTFGDVAHRAALLDDNRMRFGLDQLSSDFLGWDVEKDGLGKLPPGIGSEAEFKRLPPAAVAPYAVRNAEQVLALSRHFQPLIAEEDLGRVLALEEEVIPAVVEMEKNGTWLDMDLLARWREEVRGKVEDAMWTVYKQTGLRMSSPDSPKDLEKLFASLGIPVEARTPTGKPSFTDGVMRQIAHPTVALVRSAGHYADLLSKYLDKYAETVRADGWLRFNLHQLRAVRAEGSDDIMGTVSGRFSAAGDRMGGYNPQQVVAVEKQKERGWCTDYVIRRLFVPKDGAWVSADAKQIEYRLFAHYANSEKILAAYAANPDADFHQMVGDMLRELNPDLNRKLSKNINFMKIYGGGQVKFASMVLNVPLDSVTAEHLAKADVVRNQYDRMFPEVGPLLRKASRTAEQRGYVKTYLGRRARLRDRYHSALNRVIQGSAADINKRVLVETYKARKELGITLRLTVHDEINMDMGETSRLGRLDEVLNHQYYPTRVPILWDVAHGANWAEAK